MEMKSSFHQLPWQQLYKQLIITLYILKHLTHFDKSSPLKMALQVSWKATAIGTTTPVTELGIILLVLCTERWVEIRGDTGEVRSSDE